MVGLSVTVATADSLPITTGVQVTVGTTVEAFTQVTVRVGDAYSVVSMSPSPLSSTQAVT